MLNRVRSKVRALPIRLNHVDKGRDPSKVDNGIIVVDRYGGDVLRGGVGEGGDVREELVSLDLHSIIKKRVALPIV